MMLTDQQWNQIEDLFPAPKRRIRCGLLEKPEDCECATSGSAGSSDNL